MWRKCVDKYEVSWTGDIRNGNTGRILRIKTHKNGYKFCTVSVGGALKDLTIHREVAKAFCVNPHNKTQVNHKDGNKDNNCWSNLEWVTPEENMQHAVALGLFDPHATKKIPVTQIFHDGSTKDYASIKAAATANGYSPAGIWNVVNGKRKSYKGFCWKFMGCSVKD